MLQLRGPVLQRDKGKIAVIQRDFDAVPIAAQRDGQFVKQLLTVKTPGGMGATAMHQDAYAVLRQAFGRQQIPGQMALFASVRGPVDIDLDCRCRQTFTYRFNKTGQLFGAFFFVPQQHQEGA